MRGRLLRRVCADEEDFMGSQASETPNRLIDSTSPYLLQHAHNPVEWYPWGTEAIEKAGREDKPIFLSIGYSACHWCHVMEREVFEKHDIANIMNAHFVNVKVDREERPDLDELYMLATQLMSGSGGWPMSVWLTPDLEPFYAGTYFPPTDSYGRPGFPKLELGIADAWKNRRAEMVAQSKRVVEAIRQHADESGAAKSVEQVAEIEVGGWLNRALEQFADRFDEKNGGTGTSPKFPPHQALHLWLAMLHCPKVAELSPNDVAALKDMCTKTLDGMMRGGIYDHVGGGFARYSTDERWLVPHFEKMLYDNAQLASAYAIAATHFGRSDYARVARQTLDFWLREMRAENGALYSTLDADSEGEEGKYYVWTLKDIREALSDPGDAELIIEHFGMTDQGNWHESPVAGGNVLAIAKPVEILAKARGASEEDLQKRIDHLLVELREVRAKRVPPGLDDKVVTSWNGLMISSLAICGRLLREPRYLEAAHRAIGFLLTHHVEAGRRMLRVSRHGKAHVDAFLEDHAYLLNGLMDLIDSTSPTSLPGTMARKRSMELADAMVRDFGDAERGGFFFTSSAGEQLFMRMKSAADNATPSANGVAIRALLRLAQSSGKDRYREEAMKGVGAFATNIERRPEFFPTMLQGLLEDAETQRHQGGAGRTGVTGEGGESEIPLALEPHGVSRSPILSLGPIVIGPVVAGKVFEVSAELTVAAGYHIQPHHPKDREAFATVIRVRGDAPLESQEWTYPGDRVEYAGTVTLVGKLSVKADVPPGRRAMRATVLAQPCSGAGCLQPEKVSMDFVLEIVAV